MMKRLFTGVLVFFLSVGILATDVRIARADAWGMNIAAAILSNSLDLIQAQIEGVLLSTLKTAAVTLLNSSVSNMVGGSSVGDSKIITDWEDYLYEAPAENTRVYMDSYLASSTGGRNSLNYQDSGGSIGSYGMYLQDFAKPNLASYSDSTPVSNIQDYVADPEAALEEGDLRAFNLYFSSPMNNPYGFTFVSQGVERAKYEQEMKIQETKSVSHGYKSVEENGQVVLPGNTIGEMVAGVQALPNQIVAQSSNPSELASGLVLSFANKAISNFMQKGIGNVSSNLLREGIGFAAGGQLEAITTTAGTLSQFSPEISQQLGGISGTPANASFSIPIGI